MPVPSERRVVAPIAPPRGKHGDAPRAGGRRGKRQQILAEATRLFYRRGVRAVGVDTIAEETGVSKMTLYHHFRSKDELIVACLDAIDARYRRWLDDEVRASRTDPTERLLGIFDALKDWFADPEFRGCAFVNATVELADPAHPAREAVLAHKHRTRAWIADLATDAGLPDPDEVAHQIMLLMEGAIASAVVDGDPAAANLARSMAERLITPR